jgi:hypothetical protein
MNTILSEVKQHLHSLYSRISVKRKTNKETQVAELVGMFYTMLEEDRIDELGRAFRNQFPEYYLP